MNTPRIPSLPAHISQSDDLVHLYCGICNTVINLAFDPNYRGFISHHLHAPPAKEESKPKPWPSYE